MRELILFSLITVAASCGKTERTDSYITEETSLDSSNVIIGIDEQFKGQNTIIPGVPDEFDMVPRIYGGQKTRIQMFPWQVLLELGKEDGCSGIIISKTWILTACHCTYDLNGAKIRPDEIIVYAGVTNRSNKLLGQKRSVAKVVRHSGYGQNTKSLYDNDIALLQLSEPLEITASSMPIQIASPTNRSNGITQIGKEVTVSGWGITSLDTDMSDTLRKVNLNIIDNKIAARSYDPYPRDSLDITDNMMAASALGKDACNGDSGGPLVIRVPESVAPKRYLLVGIVSFGIGCAQPNYAGIYTRVSNYHKWIIDNISPPI